MKAPFPNFLTIDTALSNETILEYLGLTIDTQNMVVKIPADKVKELLNQIKTVASAKNVTFIAEELKDIVRKPCFI
jgi:RNA polymerase-interacting CarD/CdnL/TRCF family regulator